MMVSHQCLIETYYNIAIWTHVLPIIPLNLVRLVVRAPQWCERWQPSWIHVSKTQQWNWSYVHQPSNSEMIIPSGYQNKQTSSLQESNGHNLQTAQLIIWLTELSQLLHVSKTSELGVCSPHSLFTERSQKFKWKHPNCVGEPGEPQFHG